MAQKYYALVADQDVFGILSFDDNPAVNDSGPRMAAGLSSNPIVVEIFDEELQQKVRYGWTWNGETFVPPVE